MRRLILATILYLGFALHGLEADQFDGEWTGTLVAENQNGAEPYLVKGKFELPLNTGEINGQWKALGYRKCKFDGKGKGWTNGEHTHSWYALFAGRAGKMEFIIQGQRFVLEPGDELYYPKDAVMAAKNLHDGRSEWFACRKYL